MIEKDNTVHCDNCNTVSDAADRLSRIYSERKQEFMRRRTAQELEFAEYAQFIKKHSSYFDGKVTLPEEFSLRAMIPELYEDEPDEEVYNDQLQKTAELFKKINAVQLSMEQQNVVSVSGKESGSMVECGWDDEVWDKANKEYAARYERFIQHRTAQEMAVSEFGKGIRANAAVFKDKVEIPDVFTLEALIPELYKENPSEAEYNKQYENVVELLNSIYTVMNEYVTEVEKCLQEYNVLSSSAR